MKPGDRLLFEAGGAFYGNLRLTAAQSGTPQAPVTVGSFGLGRAVISAGAGTGILVENAGGIILRDLIVAGGGRPPGQERGWFVEPTIFAAVANSDTIAREEIFGPVLAVIHYDGVDQAVAIANDSEFGLGGSVWSRDIERANGVAKRVQTGSIGINHYMLDPAAPFGGVKASGIGRELGPEGLAAYLQLQSIYEAPPQ